MKDKNIKNFFLLFKNNIHLFLIFSLISFNNCLVEIPIKPKNIKGVPKYGIKIMEPKEYSWIDTMNQTVLANNEGKTKLNENILFLANVKIGSNEQSFNLVLDTGSYILWVPIKGSDDKHRISHHYNPDKSTTSIELDESFEEEYGTGYCSGNYYSDIFKYINKTDFLIKFGAAEETDFNVEDSDGIIGLAHYYEDESLSFIHMLKKYKITDSLSFSFKFEKDLSIGMSGKLIIGKHEDFSSDKVATCPLLKLDGNANIFWACEMSSFGMENSKYQDDYQKNYQVIFDTGTNIIMLPKSYYFNMERKFRQSGCEAIEIDDSIQIFCSYKNRLDFKLTINGYIFTIPKDLIFYEAYNNYYYSRLVFSDDMYIIGNPFFLIFHTLFDKENEKLYFYPENHKFLENDDSNISEIIFGIILLIIIIVCLGYLIYKCIQWNKAKREENNGFPSSNYNGYNQNFI